MNTIVEKFNWLARKEELAFEAKKFKGTLAGKAWKYSQSLDAIIRTRLLIFIMAAIMLYRPALNFFANDVFIKNVFVERLILCIVLITAGLLFNKFRIASIVIAVLPILLVLSSYLLIPGNFNLKIIAFNTAIIFLLCSGIYHDIRMKNIKKELDSFLVENHLLDN